MSKVMKFINFYIFLIIFVFLKSNILYSNNNYDFNNYYFEEDNYNDSLINNDNLIVKSTGELIKEITYNLKYNKNYIKSISEMYGENTLGVKFVKEYNKYLKKYGDIENENLIVSFYQNNEQQYETRIFVNLKRGSITINFLHKDLINKLVNLYESNDSAIMFFMDMSFINDFYISKGINYKQVIGMKYFKSKLLFLVLFIIIMIVLSYIYKVNKKSIINTKVEKEYDSDDNTKFIIAAALSKYLSENNNYDNCDKLNIKTIKKVNW